MFINLVSKINYIMYMSTVFGSANVFGFATKSIRIDGGAMDGDPTAFGAATVFGSAAVLSFATVLGSATVFGFTKFVYNIKCHTYINIYTGTFISEENSYMSIYIYIHMYKYINVY